MEFYTSHEGLNLIYESAQTREVPRKDGWFDLTTHLPWIGERTRSLDGAHIEFFRGIRNPVGVKVGPKAEASEVLELIETLNPGNEPGKLVLISRLGASNVSRALPGLVGAVRDAGKRVLWMSDPMHGNGITTDSGVKTRSFDSILEELERVIDVHKQGGTVLGGVHFELTGEDVTECVGGASGVREEDLGLNYASPCDPTSELRPEPGTGVPARGQARGTETWPGVSARGFRRLGQCPIARQWTGSSPFPSRPSALRGTIAEASRDR